MAITLMARDTAFATDQRGAPRPFDFISIPNAVGGDGSDSLLRDGTPNVAINCGDKNWVHRRAKRSLADGQWHRIGLIWDGSHRTLCVDGVVAAQDTQSALTSSTNGLYVGAYQNPGNDDITSNSGGKVRPAPFTPPVAPSA